MSRFGARNQKREHLAGTVGAPYQKEREREREREKPETDDTGVGGGFGFRFSDTKIDVFGKF